MNDTYKEIAALLKQSGYNDLSFVTESVTNRIMYISMYCTAILLYHKEEKIKALLHSYDNIIVSGNANLEVIIIKISE